MNNATTSRLRLALAVVVIVVVVEGPAPRGRHVEEGNAERDDGRTLGGKEVEPVIKALGPALDVCVLVHLAPRAAHLRSMRACIAHTDVPGSS